ASSDSGYVELYTPDQGEEPAKRFFFNYVLPDVLEFRDRGRVLAMLMRDGAFIQVETGTGRVKRRTPPPGDHKLRSTVASGDWSLFAGAAENGVVVWRPDEAQ